MTNLAATATALITCDYCHAAPEQRCRTRTGRRATYTHGARLDVIRPVYLDGFRDGIADALGWVRHARAHGHSLAQVEAQLAPWVRDLEATDGR